MKRRKPQGRRSREEPAAAVTDDNGNGMDETAVVTAGGATTGNGRWNGGPPFRVIVLGASAGGVEAITRVISSLPPNFPAPLFVVLHISAAAPSMLPDILTRAGRLPAQHAHDGDAISPGRIFIAPPDHHLLIKPGKMILRRGPRENSARPAVDPLFRTAARSYGPWVVGVILSGGLDDGTMGLIDVKRYGGVGLVQDPDDAMFPSMPNSAIENVRVDRVLKLDEIGPALTRLAREPVAADEGAAFMARAKQIRDRDIAEVGSDDLKTKNMDGPPSKFTCPECGGALWEIEDGKLLRYRCHIGHGYSVDSLMAAQTERLEDALWSALRALEETVGMRRRMATRARKGGWDLMARSYEEQAQHAETRAGLVRSVLVEDKPEQVTRSSARATEANSAQALDLDIGRARQQRPLAGPRLRAGSLDPEDVSTRAESNPGQTKTNALRRQRRAGKKRSNSGGRQVK